MKSSIIFRNFRWLALVLVLAITATTVTAANSPYSKDSFWMADPLFTGTPGDPTGAQPGDTVPGYWYRDTTNQNALAQYSADQFTDEVIALYNSASFNVYEYISADGPNVTLFTTPSSYGIVGCGGGTSQATAARNKMYGLIASKALRGVILTDVNSEDVWGCKVWTKGQGNVVMYANSFYDQALSEGFFTDTAREQRRQKFLGTSLPWGSDSFLGSGSMKQFTAVQPQYYQEPTYLISSQTDVSLDGNTITLRPTTENDAGLMVYFPEPGIAILGEAYGHYLPELDIPYHYRISPSEVCDFIDSLRTLSPNILVYKSGQPVIGSAEVLTAVLAQRDALQYLRDQTFNKINQGIPLDEIVATTHLTDTLAASPYNQEFASDQASIVRWVYSYSMGWFGGEPVELANTLTNTAQAQILADAYGGVDPLIEAARQTELAASDQAGAEKALYLAFSAYKLSPDNFDVKRIYSQALVKNAYMQKSAYKRNYYLLTVKDLNAQVVSDIVKTGAEDTPLAFTAAEFGQHFSGFEEALSAVTIASLPENGALNLQGVDGDGNPTVVPVTAGQEITAADLDNLVFTPAIDWNGSTSFQWNGKNFIGYAAANATVQIAIDPVNDAPVISGAPLADVTVDEDAANSDLDLSSGFSDVDLATNGDVLTYSAASSNPDLVTAAVNGSTLTLDYQENKNGTATITVTATDSGGQSISDDFTVTANPVNDAPWARSLEVAVGTGTSHAIPLEYGDVETAPENLTLIELTGPSNGSLDANLQNLVYTPNAGFSGDDQFSFKIHDRGEPDGCSTDTPPCSPALDSDLVTIVLHVGSTSISGKVVNDANGNGALEAGEAGLAGVTVELQHIDGSLVSQATTAGDGTYSFGGIAAGSYRVRQALLPGYVQTTTDPADISVTTGQAAAGGDFGAVMSADLKVSLTGSYNGWTRIILYTITVTNDGPADAAATTLTDVLPGTVRFNSVTSTLGTCSGGRTVTCDFGTLASGSSATVTLKVTRINLRAAINNTVSVASGTFDIDKADNSATVKVR